MLSRPALRPLSAALLALAACGPTAGASDPLVLYCGRSEALVGPLLERFQEDTGVRLDVRYNKTPALVTQVLAEGEACPADAVFLQDSGHLEHLAGEGLLAPLPADVLDAVDPRFRDPEGAWVGTSGRARVLVYNTDRVSPEELPRTLAELAEPKWRGRIGWAPGNGSLQAHVSALRHLWGEERTREWLEAVSANEPAVYPKNSPQVAAAHAGEIDLGWVNHYYLHQLREPGYRAANYSFPTPGDPGNVLMAAGAAVLEGAAHPEAARRLMEYLVSEPAQRFFAEEGYEYPVRPGVPTHEEVPPLASLNLCTVDQAFLADLEPTLEMLRGLGAL